MKRIIAFTLCLLLLLSLTACKPADTNAPGGAGWGDMTALQVLQQIAPKANAEIRTQIVDGADLYQNSLSLGALEFEQIALFLPMISSQRFEVAVIRVKAGTNVAKYVADLETRAANTEWVCAAPPDFVKVVSAGDLVLYVAISSDHADANALVDAFLNPTV